MKTIHSDVRQDGSFTLTRGDSPFQANVEVGRICRRRACCTYRLTEAVRLKGLPHEQCCSLS